MYTSFLVDPLYPGTAVGRMMAARERARSLLPRHLNENWELVVRKKILWAAGIKDDTSSIDGLGYTGYAFNDWNHVDATCMLGIELDNENKGNYNDYSISYNLIFVLCYHRSYLLDGA